MYNPVHLYYGDIFYFHSSPLEGQDAYSYLTEGAIAVSDGKILAVDTCAELKRLFPDAGVTDYSGKLIMPGFIDSHIHYPQSEIIGMYGKQLLDWLNEYTFPAELAFASPEHAVEMARFFVRELFRNGTTSCMAYATVHPESVHALFSVAREYEMCMITGKVLMDRNAPEGLLDTAGKGIPESRSLIETYHNKGRNRYAITPRFAISCSDEQLRAAACLHAEFPDTYIQTHLSENKHEIDHTLSLYPGCRDYFEVYEHAGLVNERAVFGHCIHLSASEYRRFAGAGAVVAHCPTSNLFLGSGLFDMKEANRLGMQTTLATDVGGGTSFSMLRTMGEAYKVQQLNGYSMPALESLYKCTLGTAKALKLEDEIGSFKTGCFADFIVVEDAVTHSQLIRKDYLVRTGKWNLDNLIFGLQILGDDRNIAATYIKGKEVHIR